MHQGECGQAPNKAKQLTPDIHYYAGDWSQMDSLLSIFDPGPLDEIGISKGTQNGVSQEAECLQEGSNQDVIEKHDSTNPNTSLPKRHVRKLSSSRACERATDDAGALEGGYDVILMSETVYSVAALPKLYALIMKVFQIYMP